MMGMFDKLAFWKKDDDVDFDKLADQAAGKTDLPHHDNLDMEEKNRLGLDEKPMFPEDPAGQTNQLPHHLQESAMPSDATTSPTPGSAAQHPMGPNRDLELINSKLDTLKATLTSVEQRIANIEKAMGAEQKPKLW